MNGGTSFETALGELCSAERDLMLQRESVAQLRRDLPAGPIVEDYEFDGADGALRLSELFSSPDRSLILYHFMLGKQQTTPCPMCALWADGWNSIAHHLATRVDFALVSAAPIEATLDQAKAAGWTSLRWLSAKDNTFKADIGGEDAEGNQWPFISVYRLTDDGPQLTYASDVFYPGGRGRGLDLLTGFWSMLDLTPEGRGDHHPAPPPSP